MGFPILWISGPSGVGKTTIGLTIYEELNREGDLTGFVVDIAVGLASSWSAGRYVTCTASHRARVADAAGRRSPGVISHL